MQTLILDSSQLTTWCGCQREWAYVNGENIIAIDRNNPRETLRPSEAIAMGTLGHKYLEIYYQNILSGGPEIATRAALALNPDTMDEAEKEFPLSAELRQRVRNRFVDYVMTYSGGRDILPATKQVQGIGVSADGTLCDTITNEPLVEKGFSYNLFESSEYLFVLEGRIDMIGRTKDFSIIWEDHKFQLREHQLYSKSIQFRNYSLVTKLNLAVINYVRLHEKVGAKTFVRQPISFSSLEMHHWRKELTEIFVSIAKQITRGHYELNRANCSRFGSVCQFAPLCEEYDPQTRGMIKRRDYTQRKVWRPW